MGSDFEEFGFGGEEFFPLDDDSIMDGSGKSEPNLSGESGKSVKGLFGKSKTYFKNVAKSVKAMTFTVAQNQIPNVMEFGSALAETVTSGKDKLSEERQKISEKIAVAKDKIKSSGGTSGAIGKTIKEMGSDIKKAVTTGEFYKDPNEIDLGSMFGDDDDFSFDDDGDKENSSNDNTTNGEAVAEKTSKPKSQKSPKNKKQSTTVYNKKNIFIAKQDNTKSRILTDSIMTGTNAQIKASMIMHTASSALSELQFKQQMGAYEAIYGALEKIANFTADYGTKDISAGMEYRAKSIAMQEDNLNLLKELKEATVTGLGVNALLSLKEAMPESEREKVLGSNLNGSEYFENIKKRAKSAFSNTGIGSMMDMAGMAGDMGDMVGKSKLQMGKDMIMGSIPGMFLSKRTKSKMERLNDIFGTMGGAMTMKFNDMARYSNNPIVRGLASMLGVDDTMAKRVDHGVKDPSGKAIFDNAVHRSIVEVIPGLLSKQLAVATGDEEIYYDMKTGAFKTSSSAVDQYKYEENRTYSSSTNLNEAQELMTTSGAQAAKDRGLDPKEISDDFEKIKKNIVKSKSLFSPDLLMGKNRDSQDYRAFLSKGLKHPDISLVMYADQFSKLKKGDQLAFTTGLAEVLQNRERFVKDTKQSMMQNGAPASLVEHLEREDFDDRNSALAYSHLREDKYKEGSSAQLNARKQKIEYEEKLSLAKQGRVGVYGGMYDDGTATLTGGSKIEDMASGYNEGKGPAAILSNIYNLLLDGVVVFPQNFTGADGKMPKHLQKRATARVENAQAFQEISESREQKERDNFDRILKDKIEYQRTRKAQRVGASTMSIGDVFGAKFEEARKNGIVDRTANKFVDATENFAHNFLLGGTKNAGEGSEAFDALELEGLERVNDLLKSGQDTSLVGLLKKATEGKDTKFTTMVNKLADKLSKTKETLIDNTTSLKDKIKSSKEYEKTLEEARKLRQNINKAKDTAVGFAIDTKDKAISKARELDPNLDKHIDQTKSGFNEAKVKAINFAKDKIKNLNEQLHGEKYKGDFDAEIEKYINEEKESNNNLANVQKTDISSYYPSYMKGSAASVSLVPQPDAYASNSHLTLPDIFDVRLTDVSLDALNKLLKSNTVENVKKPIDTDIETSVSQKIDPPSITEIIPVKKSKSKPVIKSDLKRSSKDISKVQSFIQKKYQFVIGELEKIKDPEQRKVLINDFYKNSQAVIESVESKIPENMKPEYDKVKASFDKFSNSIIDTMSENKKKFNTGFESFKEKFKTKKKELGAQIMDAKETAINTMSENKKKFDTGFESFKEKAKTKKKELGAQIMDAKETAEIFFMLKGDELSASLKSAYNDFEDKMKKATSEEERARIKEEFLKFINSTAPEKAQAISASVKSAYDEVSSKVIKLSKDIWKAGKDKFKQTKDNFNNKISEAQAERDDSSQSISTPEFKAGSSINVFVTGFSKEASEIVSSFSPPNARDRKRKFKNSLKEAKYNTKLSKMEARKKKKEEKAMRKAHGKKGFIRKVSGRLAGGAVALGKGAGSLAAGGFRVAGGAIGGVFGGVGSFAKSLFSKRKISLGNLLKEVKKGLRPFDEALTIVRGLISDGKIDATQGVAFLDKAVEMELINRKEADKILVSWKNDKLLKAADIKKYKSNSKEMGGYVAGTGISLENKKLVKSKKPGFIKNSLSALGSALGIAGGGVATLATSLIAMPLKALRKALRKRVDQRYDDEKKLSGIDFKKILNDIKNGRVTFSTAMHKMYTMMKRGQLDMKDLLFFLQELINTDDSNKDRALDILKGWVGDGYLTKAEFKKYASNLEKHGSLTYGLKDPNIFKRKKPRGIIESALNLAGGAVTLAKGVFSKGKKIIGSTMHNVGKAATWVGNRLRGKKGDNGELVRKGSAEDILSSKSSNNQNSALLSMAKDVATIRLYVSKLKGFPLNKKELEKTLKEGGGNGDGSQNNGVSKWRSRLGKMVSTAGTVAGGAVIAAGAANMVRGSVGALNKFGESSDMAAEGANAGQVIGHTLGSDSSGKYDWQGNEKNRTYMQTVQDNASVSKVAQAATGMRGITKVGKGIISGSKKLGQKIAKNTLTEGPGVLSKLTGFLQKMFTKKPFSNFISKGVVGKLVKAIVSKISGSALGKMAAKIAGSIAKAAVPIGWAMIAADFVSGMSQTSRYFRLPKGVAPNIGMRVTSGIVNTLSGLLFGLLPPEIIAPLIYNLIGSDETKEFLKEGKLFGAERANVLGVETERLVEYETRPLGEKVFGGAQKASAQIGYGTKPEDIAAFKEWESKKYKPVQDIYNRIKEKFGGSVVEKEPSKPGDKEKQKEFRKEVISETDKFVKSNKLDSLKPGSDPQSKNEDGSEIQDAEGDAEGEAETKEKEPKTVADAALAGSVGGGEAFGMSNDGISVSNDDSSTATAVSDDKPAVAASIATASTTSAVAGIASTQEKETISNTAKTSKAVIEKQPNASISEPPMITDAKEMTEIINEQLDAMKALLQEQSRHNSSVEVFFEDLKELLIRGFKLDPAMNALEEARKKAAEELKREKENKGMLAWLKGEKSDEQLAKENAAALSKTKATYEVDVRTDVTSGT